MSDDGRALLVGTILGQLFADTDGNVTITDYDPELPTTNHTDPGGTVNTPARSSRYQPLHYPDGSNLRDRDGRLWMPLGPGAHYIRQGQVGEPALSFQNLATQHGPMVREIKSG